MATTHHEIYTGEYVINTRPLQDFIWTIQRWMLMGILGGYAYGFPRIGKTSMINAALKKLRTRTGEPVPAFLISEKTVSTDTDKKYLSYILSDLRIASKSSANARDLRTTLVGFCRNEAMSNLERRIVLFIDEAQKMTKLHYEILQDLLNEFRQLQVNALVVSVGSNRMPERVSQYDRVSDAQILGRFFCGVYRIFGLRTLADVQHALAWYDKPHPEQGVLKSFTEALIPDAYASGFRMADNAKVLWKAFEQGAGAQRSETGWGMQYFSAAVRNLLADMIGPEGEITDDQAEEAVRFSGIQGAVEIFEGEGMEDYEDA